MKFVDNKKKYSLLKLGAVVIAALVILDIIGRKYEKKIFYSADKTEDQIKKRGCSICIGIRADHAWV